MSECKTDPKAQDCPDNKNKQEFQNWWED
jgi:hypothetical protein